MVTLEDLLRMATLGGAEALGLEGQLGSLESGKRADIVIVSPRHPDMQPVYDPVFTAARGLSGRNVEAVLVEGRLVVADGAVTTLDEPELHARVAERWPVIMERFESMTGSR